MHNPITYRSDRVKRLIAMGLLAVFLFYISGYYLAFGLFRHSVRLEARQNMLHNLSDKDLQVFTSLQTLSKDFIWIEYNKEFRFKGEMFDVVKIINTKGSLELMSIPDKKESQLMASFSIVIEKDFSCEKTAKYPVSKIIELLSLYNYWLKENNSLTPFHSVANLLFFYKSTNQCIDLQVPKPPPKNNFGLIYS